MKKEIAIKVNNLSKKYTIGKNLDENLRSSLGKVFDIRNKNSEIFWALKDVSFDIEKGDVVGIIGKNGAGKSTLLKVLSQITKPSSGRIEITGRVASLLEVGTGFHPELTGRENIFLNGTILGMSRKEVKSKFDEIVSFSGVEKFIDTPVKRYSSGMYVRLAFAVAANLDPEILIIDEVLAVGDAEFQKKCIGKMQDVASHGRTVLFVSHSMAAIKSLCNKGICMSGGEIKSIGDITNIIRDYTLSESTFGIYIPLQQKNNIDLSFKEIKILNDSDKVCTHFTCEDNIKFQFDFNINNFNKSYSLFAIIKDKYGAPVFAAETKIDSTQVTLLINKNFLTRGDYHLNCFIHIPNIQQIDFADDICHFNIIDTTTSFAIHGTYEYGNVFGSYKWL